MNWGLLELRRRYIVEEANFGLDMDTHPITIFAKVLTLLA
jgi:hypothetical protein